MSHKLIENVSDTARWVAYYRAMESERPDALFRDPWARKLAGERGAAIVRHIPRAKAMAWALIVRTQVFDELILNAVNINLVAFARFGAGVGGWVLTLFTIAITVTEVAVGLAIVIVIFRVRRTVDADHLHLLRG